MPLILVVEGRHVLRRTELDLPTSMPGFTAASDTGVVSIQAPKTPVATTNEAANRENLRVIDLSC
jgi:hypothetical protein